MFIVKAKAGDWSPMLVLSLVTMRDLKFSTKIVDVIARKGLSLQKAQGCLKAIGCSMSIADAPVWAFGGIYKINLGFRICPGNG